MLLRILQDNAGGSLDSRTGGVGGASSSSASEGGGGANAGSSASAGGGAVCENEFIVKCLYRLFNFLKADATPDISLPALGMVLEMIKRVSSNPSNPSFSHFLFESLATIVKVLTVSQEYRPTVEAQVVPVLSVLIQQTVHDFIPYCFQVGTRLRVKSSMLLLKIDRKERERKRRNHKSLEGKYLGSTRDAMLRFSSLLAEMEVIYK